jgi:hypothetical protein
MSITIIDSEVRYSHNFYQMAIPVGVIGMRTRPRLASGKPGKVSRTVFYIHEALCPKTCILSDSVGAQKTSGQVKCLISELSFESVDE